MNAEQILAMTVDQHATRAAKILADDERFVGEHRLTALAEAGVHLQFAQLKRMSQIGDRLSKRI